MHLRLVSTRPAWPTQPMGRRAPPSRRALIQGCQARVEAAWERDFRDGSLVDLRPALRGLPLLVQCAVRVHDRREIHGAQLLGLDAPGPEGRTQRWPVLVARAQRLVLLFSKTGALDAAGRLVPSPSRPVSFGEKWTRIDWASDVTRHDWY